MRYHFGLVDTVISTRPIRLLVAKAGLNGHACGTKIIARISLS
jgi:methylmalonyl-CoA mutase cobalamin-binding subunit